MSNKLWISLLCSRGLFKNMPHLGPAWNPELGQLEAAMAQIPILLPALSSSVERHSVCNLFFLNPLKGDPCQST